MFNLNLSENLKMFIQIIDPENELKIKDVKTAMDYINDISKKNEPKRNIDILMASIPKLELAF